jgi:hypothetical protein
MESAPDLPSFPLTATHYTGWMSRMLGRAAVGLIATLAVLYLGDWAIWRARLARGDGMGKVSVSRIEVAPLKGNKEEYYWDGTADVDCSRSIFPQAGSGACWWLARHEFVFDR